MLEDDQSTRTLLKDILESEVGVAVAEAGDAEHALELLDDAAELPALLIVDLMLPGLDGETFMQAVRRRFGPDLPIMVLSALRPDQIQASAKRGEAQSYMVKPFDIGELVAEVARLLPGEPGEIRKLRD